MSIVSTMVLWKSANSLKITLFGELVKTASGKHPWIGAQISVHLLFFYFSSLVLLGPTNLVSYFSSESVQNAWLIRF